ncbi:unnamed protein product [Brachionus calyciflorus]|uniref:Reverse transcriptase domain-containing protein n=1 Tax=Brachionus calyciflorus TaxID=104777 RepID=A0A814AJ56_9BILA|nr:unnamed protein product [Brachionus calyciflorus]
MASFSSNSILQFDCDPYVENLGPKWTRWIDRLDQYFAANGVTDDARMKSALFFLGGEQLNEIHKTLDHIVIPGTVTSEYGKSKHRLTTYFSPKKNRVVEVYKFIEAKQTVNESIFQYITRLRMLGEFCGFTDLNQEIVTHVIQTCYSDKLRRQFLEKDEVTYDDLVKIGRLFDNVEDNAKIVEGKIEIKEEAVNKISKRPMQGNFNFNKKCFNCGRSWPHKDESCPAKGKPCNKCNKMNHFASVCRSIEHDYSQKTINQNKINQIINGSNNDKKEEHEKELICAVTSKNSRFPELEFLVNDEKIKLRIDTLAKPTLLPVISPPYAYGSSEPIKTVGRFKAKLKIFKKEIDTEFIVTCGKSGSLIGYPTCLQLGVDPIAQIVNSISIDHDDSEKLRNYYKDKFPKLFSGKIGELKDFEIDFYIDKSIKPLKLENDIIEEVENDPTSWLSETVKIPKKGTNEIRLCIDTTAVNKAILSEKYEMPTAEDFIYAANGMKFFSKADLNSAFEQFKLSKRCRYISRFRTHKGIFQYKRLFFGIKCAPEIFHKEIRKILEGIPCQFNASDDIMMMGKTLEEHNATVLAVFERLESKGLTVNIDKCVFCKTSITFFGLILSNNSISLNEQKTIALKNASAPRNASELDSFLGLSVYASRWIQNLASISKPLWDLTRNDAKFEWTTNHQSCFEQIKNGLIQAVSYFDCNWDTQVTVDAGPDGIGGVLTQSDPKDKSNVKIVIFVSRILTETEKKYSQIEKEGLSCVWVCERLELFLIGKIFDLIVDNKAISLIFKNPLCNPPARIQRWLLRLSPFQFNIIHRLGKGNIADFLSRHPNKKLTDEYEDDVEEFLKLTKV